MRDTLGRLLPVVGVVAAVTVIVLVASILQASHPRSPQLPTPTASVASVTDLDLGQVSSAGQVARCLGRGFATRPTEVQVLYGVQQRRGAASNAVFVLRNRSGALRLCDASGADRPTQSPVPTLARGQQVAFLSNGRSTWDCVGRTRRLKQLLMTAWLLVSPEVDAVQQRYWVSGRPGGWFTTSPQSGFAHLQSWVAGPQPADATYAVQYRLLDRSGHVLPQRVLPMSRQPLPGCVGASTVIG